MGRGSSWRLTVVVGILVCAALFSPPAAALNIGIQSAGDGASKQQACSRTCESDHCTTAPFLRYGKYCGILYSGCPGEQPCDALDACCMHHDNCVQAKMDYLSTSCNEALLDCLARLREGTSTSDGNKCMIDEVICWNLYGLGPITNCEISNKSQRPIHVSKRGCGNSLIPPCLWKWR